MSTRRTVGLLALVGLCVGLGALASGAVDLRAWTVDALVPKGAFDAATAPPAPDYADDANWSALPTREDAGDAAPDGLPAVDQARAPADVFYVHPTSHVGPTWTGPVDDPRLNADTDRLSTGIQATAFNGCCAVYAPRYRQVNGLAFARPGPDAQTAIDLAYDDVRRAFGEFLRRRGPDRPFVLAAHSQGSVHAERLLVEVIAPSPLAGWLVYAVLPGGRVTEAGLAERAPNVPPCEGPDDVGCVVAWNARQPGFVGNAFDMHRDDPRPLLCTNPLTGRHDAQTAPADANLGAVFLEDADHRPRPGFADATCRDGVLWVDHLGSAPREIPSQILDRLMGPGNLHPMEYQLFFVNLRADAARRVAAWTARGVPSAATAPPPSAPREGE